MFNANLVALSRKTAAESDLLSVQGFDQSFSVRHQSWLRGSQGATAFDESKGSRGRTSSRTNESGNEPGAAARPGLAFPIRKSGGNLNGAQWI